MTTQAFTQQRNRILNTSSLAWGFLAHSQWPALADARRGHFTLSY